MIVQLFERTNCQRCPRMKAGRPFWGGALDIQLSGSSSKATYRLRGGAGWLFQSASPQCTKQQYQSLEHFAHGTHADQLTETTQAPLPQHTHIHTQHTRMHTHAHIHACTYTRMHTHAHANHLLKMLWNVVVKQTARNPSHCCSRVCKCKV